MNLIFKIIEYLPDTEQIIVKFCRQNAPKSIDEYYPAAINCKDIDFSEYERFVASIMNYGIAISMDQEKNEDALPQNKVAKETFIVSIEENLNKIIGMDTEQVRDVNNFRMNEIDLIASMDEIESFNLTSEMDEIEL
jgi:hypothetical protein